MGIHRSPVDSPGKRTKRVLCCLSQQTDEKTADLQVIWYAMVLMWCHCNGRATKWSEPWWRHAMQTLSWLLALCEGNLLVIGSFQQKLGELLHFINPHEGSWWEALIFIWWSEQTVEWTVVFPIIWEALTLMWPNYNDKSATILGTDSFKCISFSETWIFSVV